MELLHSILCLTINLSGVYSAPDAAKAEYIANFTLPTLLTAQTACQFLLVSVTLQSAVSFLLKRIRGCLEHWPFSGQDRLSPQNLFEGRFQA